MIIVQTVGFGAAFTAGLLTFFSPCVVPLIPAWLTLITGLSYEELKAAENRKYGFGRLLIPTLLFVAGFSLVFVSLGAAASFVGGLLERYNVVVRYLGGAFLIVMGLYLLGVISPKALSTEKRVHFNKRPLGLIGSFLVGMAFAAGWTPCVGPVLGSILMMAAYETTMNSGMLFLAMFSLGLAVPFLLISLMWGGALSLLRKFSRVSGRVNQVLGFLILILAVLVISGYLSPSGLAKF